jgi:pimeloyl-ACP methyl ester carboxylesterase
VKLNSIRIPFLEGHLAGLVYTPDTENKSISLLFAHGFTSGKYSLDGLAGYLAGRGYVGLSFDFVGHKLGATGGEMHSIAQARENVQSAVQWLRASFPEMQIVLVGHSLGAAACLSVAKEEQVSGVVALCMGTEPTLGFQGVVGKTMQTQRQDYVAGAPVPQLLEEVESLLPLNGELQNLPTLFVAARQDVLFSIDRVEALASRAGRNTKVATLEASHLEAPDKAKAVVLKFLESISFGHRVE